MTYSFVLKFILVRVRVATSLLCVCVFCISYIRIFALGYSERPSDMQMHGAERMNYKHV